MPAVDVDQLSSGVSINTKQKVFSFKPVNGERIQFFKKYSSRFRFELDGKRKKKVDHCVDILYPT